MASSELSLRVRRLERLLILATLLAIAPWIAIGVYLVRNRDVALPFAISARGLRVVDENNRPLVALATDRSAGAVRVLASDGRELARLGIDTANSAGHLALRNKEGKELVELGDFQKHGGSIELKSAAGIQIAYLGPDREGGGNLSISAEDGKSILVARDDVKKGGSLSLQLGEEHGFARLGCDREGNGQLRLLTSEEKDLFFLGASTRGDGQLEISRHDGQNYAYTLVDDHGVGMFGLLTPKETSAMRFDADPQGGELHLYNSASSEVLYAGWTNIGSAQMVVYDDHLKKLASIGISHRGFGGGVHAYGEDERPVFYGGVNDREGSGLLSLFHRAGPQIFGAGLDASELGGVINVRDKAGKMTLRVP